jgi:hypothetical protein
MRAHAPVALIATCPFTLVAGLGMAGRRIPVVYIAYETYEVHAHQALRSPLSWGRSRAAFRRVRDADLVCVPSAERAGWLLARAGLDRAPTIMLNCPARQAESPEQAEWARPAALLGRAIVVHTGRVSQAQAIVELVDSVAHWPADAALVVTNVGNSAYDQSVRSAARASPRAADILLLPAVPRSEMLSLQRAAAVGIFLTRDTDALETLMPAPNKVGEYLHAGLITVAPQSAYMQALERHGVAELFAALTPTAIAAAVRRALDRRKRSDQQSRIESVAQGWYNMDVQAIPLVRLLDSLPSVRSVARLRA